MKPSSAKAKGRRFQQWICAEILKRFPQLGEDDVVSRGMGGAGEDVILSTAARELVPLSIEAKNQERFSIWEALRQAEANAKEGHIPCVFFTRNRTPNYVALPAETLLDLLKFAADMRELAGSPSDVEEMAKIVAEYIEREHLR